MKTINIPLEDKDYNRLKKLKGELSWREFILQTASIFRDKVMRGEK